MLFPMAVPARAELPASPPVAGALAVAGAGDPADRGTSSETVFGLGAAPDCALADAVKVCGDEADGPPRLIT